MQEAAMDCMVVVCNKMDQKNLYALIVLIRLENKELIHVIKIKIWRKPISQEDLKEKKRMSRTI